jgi:hypothetical protein
VSLLQGAELERLIQKPDTYILYADVAAAGGTQRDVKNVFTLLTGDWLSYSGGLIVNVAMIKSSNTSLVFADTLRYRTDFTNYFGISPFKSPEQSDLVENNNSGSNVINLCNQERHKHLFHKAVTPTDCAVTSGNDDPVQITGFQLDAKEIGGNGDAPVLGTITLDRALTQDTTVAVQVTSNKVTIPVRTSTATVKANTSAGVFTVLIPEVKQKTDFTVSAKLNNRPGGAFTLTRYPRGLFLQPTVVVGGESLEAILALAAPASSGSVQVIVTASDTSIGTVPTITVPKGSSLVHFAIPTNPVKTQDTPVITAKDTVGGATVNDTATPILQPASTAAKPF